MKRKLGDVWKDQFVSYAPWRVQAPRGIASFRTKKRALVFSAMWKGTITAKAASEMVMGGLV